MMWHDDYLQAVTTVITAITNEQIVDRYRTTGTVVQQMGWKVLDIAAEGRKRETKGSAEEKAPEQVLPVTLAKVSCRTSRISKRERRRPGRRNDSRRPRS